MEPRPVRLHGWVLLGVAVIVSLAASACGSKSEQVREKRFHLKGTVVQVDKAQQHLVIDHEEIPGFMAAMTMPYPVVRPADLDQVAAGDQITADVVVVGETVHLENIVVVKKAEPKSGAGGQARGPSEVPPNFTLVNQDGRKITLSQYRGKSVLLTFIYTRCPLPEYCPLATHNFAEIEKSLANTPGLYAKTHLLSISFDSAHDTPQVLRDYARSYIDDQGGATFKHWEFATVPASEKQQVLSYFNVFLSEEGGQITHSMSTAIVSPDGTLHKTYSSNDWKPADLVADLSSSVAGESASVARAAQ